MKIPREDKVLFMCLVSWLLRQSFLQQLCISLLHIICISLSGFSEMLGIIIIISVKVILFCVVARSGLTLTYCIPVRTDTCLVLSYDHLNYSHLSSKYTSLLYVYVS